MAIDLSSLGLPKAVLTKSTQPQRPYRENAEQIRERLAEAMNSGHVQDLVEASGNAGAAQKIADAATGEVQIRSNYSSDVFFNREMPNQIDADGGYTVGGVKFSEGELTQARAVLTTAARSISAGPGRNTNLDYRNYAQMSIAEQAVSAYAKDNLSEDQQRVVNGAMREYNEALISWQDSILGTIPETTGTSYYGRGHALSQAEADMVNSFKAELSRLTGRSYTKTIAGESGGYDQVAANKDLIRQISSVFSGADLGSTQGRQNALDQYAELMKPVYRAQGITTGVDKVLHNDTNSLSKMFDAILAKQRSPISLAF